ncbi:hypothetical protein GCM10025866_10910 [Naasia aerilata]|uniref:Uncharacterized protein n=1 Tax=Naasia aerilata TaxID=1162966 RepID=A0ABN6XMY1_9MICO|nr:hypothetical protein [Naasia aerilata]BDZ45182.1 hypothetical protein GCM10025866_10910 [Naasia aerilata]
MPATSATNTSTIAPTPRGAQVEVPGAEEQEHREGDDAQRDAERAARGQPRFRPPSGGRQEPPGDHAHDDRVDRIHDRRGKEQLLPELHDPRVERDGDRSGRAEHPQLQAQGGQQACEGQHEARNTEAGVQEAVDDADDRAAGEGGEQDDRQRQAQLGSADREDRAREAAHRPDRQVDLPDEQQQDDPDRDDAGRRGLHREVHEVGRAEEHRVEDPEHEPDQRQSDQHGRVGEVTGADAVDARGDQVLHGAGREVRVLGEAAGSFLTRRRPSAAGSGRPRR